MKKILFVLLIFVYNVSAIQDSFITIDSKNSDICFAVDDYTNTVCNGSIMTVEGTKDNVLYIVPKSSIKSSDNLTTQFIYIVNTPLNWLVGVFMFIGFIGMIFTVFYGVAYFLTLFSRG